MLENNLLPLRESNMAGFLSVTWSDQFLWLTPEVVAGSGLGAMLNEK